MTIHSKLAISFILTLSSLSCFGKRTSVVSKYGQLSIDSIFMKSEQGEPVQLKGMSFFWSQWQSQYWNKGVVKFLARDWNCGIVRAAMGVGKGGYLTYPQVEQAKVETIVNAAIKEDIYVIIDWHSHHAEDNLKEAKIFFANMAQKYGENPHVLYEIYNEPLCTWEEIKVYAEEVIDTIRHHDPDNIIIVGTPTWSQKVDAATANPIDANNIAYTLHFYAATHKQELRDIAQVAIDRGFCIFVTEFGTCKASGNGTLDFEETELWMEWMDKYKISWCNWSVCDKNESASALKPEANTWGNWLDYQLTESGKFIRNKLLEMVY